MVHGYSAYSGGKCRCDVCKQGWREYMRAYRQDPERRKRAYARSYVGAAIKLGHIEPEPCEVCGSLEVQGHHDDYDNRLDVRWLCRRHHHEAHGESVGMSPHVWSAA